MVSVSYTLFLFSKGKSKVLTLTHSRSLQYSSGQGTLVAWSHVPKVASDTLLQYNSGSTQPSASGRIPEVWELAVAGQKHKQGSRLELPTPCLWAQLPTLFSSLPSLSVLWKARKPSSSIFLVIKSRSNSNIQQSHRKTRNWEFNFFTWAGIQNIANPWRWCDIPTLSTPQIMPVKVFSSR